MNHELPDRYGRTELVLMVVDPLLLFAYWEVTPESLRQAQHALGTAMEGARAVLRLLDIALIRLDGAAGGSPPPCGRWSSSRPHPSPGICPRRSFARSWNAARASRRGSRLNSPAERHQARCSRDHDDHPTDWLSLSRPALPPPLCPASRARALPGGKLAVRGDHRHLPPPPAGPERPRAGRRGLPAHCHALPPADLHAQGPAVDLPVRTAPEPADRAGVERSPPHRLPAGVPPARHHVPGALPPDPVRIRARVRARSGRRLRAPTRAGH